MSRFLNIKLNIIIGLMYFFYNISLCSFLGFLVVFLHKYNYSSSFIGIIIAMVILIKIVSQPLIGYLSDKKKTIKKILILFTVISAAFSLLIPLYSQQLYIIVIVCIVYSVFSNSMLALLESFTILKQKTIPSLNYGIIRSAGSLGFCISGYIIGRVLENTDAKIIFYIYAVSSLLFIISCMFVSEKNIFSEDIKKSHISFKEFRHHLSGNYPFLLLFIVSTVIFIPYLTIGLYLPIILTSLGGSDTDYGLALFIMAASEIPVLVISKKLLLKYKDTALIIIALFLCVLRTMLHSFLPSVNAQIFLCSLQSGSSALFLPVSLFFVNRISPEKYTTTYLTLLFSGYLGIAYIIASVVGGFLIDCIGVFSTIRIFSFVAAIAFAALVFKYKTLKNI